MVTVVGDSMTIRTWETGVLGGFGEDLKDCQCCATKIKYVGNYCMQSFIFMSMDIGVTMFLVIN